MADRWGGPWALAFSRKGKQGGSEVFIAGHGECTPPIFLKLRESWSKDGHAAREIVTVHYVIFFISNNVLLLLVVGQIVKTPLPPPMESVSAHIC